MNAIETLKSNPPSRILNYQQARARVIELESALGLPHAEISFRVKEFTARVAQLEFLKSRQDSAAATSRPQDAIPLESAPAKPSAEQSGKPMNETERCLASVAHRKKHATAIEIAKLRAIAAQSSGITKTALESKITKLSTK